MPRFQRCDVTSGPSVLGRRGRRAVQTRAEPDNDEVHDRHRDHEQQDLYHEPAGSRTWGEPPDHQPIVGGRPRFHATERPTEHMVTNTPSKAERDLVSGWDLEHRRTQV